MSFVDPTENSIERLGDEDGRKKELAFLQKSLGNDNAASNLFYEIKDADKMLFSGHRGRRAPLHEWGEQERSRTWSNHGNPVVVHSERLGNRN